MVVTLAERAASATIGLAADCSYTLWSVDRNMEDKKPMPEATANEEVRDFIRDLVQADLARGPATDRCAYRKLYTAIMMMKATEDRLGSELAEPSHRPMARRILVQ